MANRRGGEGRDSQEKSVPGRRPPTTSWKRAGSIPPGRSHPRAVRASICSGRTRRRRERAPGCARSEAFSGASIPESPDRPRAGNGKDFAGVTGLQVEIVDWKRTVDDAPALAGPVSRRRGRSPPRGRDACGCRELRGSPRRFGTHGLVARHPRIATPLPAWRTLASKRGWTTGLSGQQPGSFLSPQRIRATVALVPQLRLERPAVEPRSAPKCLQRSALSGVSSTSARDFRSQAVRPDAAPAANDRAG